MIDFSHLSKLNVTDESIVDYPLEELEGSPVLRLRPATESNAKYTNEVLRLSGQSNGQRKKQKMKVSLEEIQRLRNQDRDLYPKHVIAGWSGITDVDGKDVDFTVEACAQFIAALPDWIFDPIRVTASNPETFALVIDSEAKAGN